MASLSLRGVRKDFGKTQVIQGVDLDVADGEFRGLRRPFWLRQVDAAPPDRRPGGFGCGRIRIGGRVVDGVAAKDRDIAMVFQNYALYPHMSVARNMGFGLRARRLPAADIDRRVRAVAAVLGLEALLERRPGELSGGQRQRVAMGRAMVREPAVFLFDEPLSNLDAQLRDQVRTEIKTLHERVRTTSIYVTHDQMEAMTLADRIVLLRSGRVEQVGAPMELFARPANRFVAGFIGAPAMNFCAGRLQDGAIVLPWGRLPAPPLAAAAAVDGRVEVGIRPEDFLAGDAARGRPHRAEARVTVVEPLGSEALLLVELANVSFRLRVPGKAYPKPGDAIAVALDPAGLHLFDAETGVSLRA